MPRHPRVARPGFRVSCAESGRRQGATVPLRQGLRGLSSSAAGGQATARNATACLVCDAEPLASRHLATESGGAFGG